MNVPASSSSSSILSISSYSGRSSHKSSIIAKKSFYFIVFTFLLFAVSASSTTTSTFTSTITMLMTRAFARDASSVTAFASRRARTATISSSTTTPTTTAASSLSSSLCNTANVSNGALVGTIASTPCHPPPSSGTPRFTPFSSVGRFRRRGCIPRQFHTRYPVNDWQDFETQTQSQTQTMLTMASTDSDTDSDTDLDSDTEAQPTKTIDSKWNVPALKKEAARQTLRCHKKIGKASLRLQQCSDNDNDDEEQQLQQEQQLEMLRTRLVKLNTLEENLSSLPSKRNVDIVLPEDVAKLVLELDVREEPVRQARNTKKKKKGPSEKQVQRRKPYRRYFALDQTEIRVGKQAEDNDELSCNPLHRDGSDWWMHASGCPGSHVVIRSNSSPGNLSEEVVMDAAALAARQSKCTGGTIRVSMIRCRNVSKPPGAKPGLVRLNGDVRTVVVNMKAAEERLKRLDDTCLVN